MKIDPECLTISGLPAALCLANHADADEDQLFVDINKKSCTFFATVGGQIQVLRSFGLPPSETSRPQVLITQIKRTLAAFDEMDLSEFQPIHIMISGDGLDTEGLTEDIAEALNMEVKAANLADRLDIPIEAHAADSWKPAHFDDALALAYLLCGPWNVFPLVGCDTPEQLEANIAALDVKLTTEDVAYLDLESPTR